MNRLMHKICTITFLSLTLVIFQSCSEDAKSDTNQELTQAELKTILETDDITGVADSALAELFADNGSTGKSAKSNECYSAEYSETGFVATFNNCVLNGTDNVNGTLTVTYAVGNESAAFTATYEDFYVGTIKINGTRSFTVNSSVDQNTISFTVTSDVSVEFENGSTVSENGTKTFEFTFGASLPESTFNISGSWTIQADGNTYAVGTVDDLQGNFSCEHLTSGSMVVSKNGLAVTVDFGDGVCDDKAVVIYPNGATEEITL